MLLQKGFCLVKLWGCSSGCSPQGWGALGGAESRCPGAVLVTVPLAPQKPAPVTPPAPLLLPWPAGEEATEVLCLWCWWKEGEDPSGLMLNLSVWREKSFGLVFFGVSGPPQVVPGAAGLSCEGFGGDGQELLMVLICRCWEELGKCGFSKV